MTHDRLCWFADPALTAAAAVSDGWPCVCDLIAKVRADSEAAINAAEHRRSAVPPDRAYVEGYRKGYLTALRWAFEAAFETLQTEQQTSEKRGKP